MIITQYSKTIYPQTLSGMKIAAEMEQKLKEQGCFLRRKEDTQGIIIESEYRFVIEDEHESNN